VADTEDPGEDEVVTFAASYHLEWILGPDVEVVFTQDGDSQESE
jgi:hypothetical protein